VQHSLQPLVRSDRWKEGIAIHPSDPVRGCYSDPTSEGTDYRANYLLPDLTTSSSEEIDIEIDG